MKNNVLSQNQYAFVAGSGTSDNMADLTSAIKNHLDNNKKDLTVFLDLAKAFDNVLHEGLMDVLQQGGWAAWHIVECFCKLSVEHYTRIGGSLSNPKVIRIGIPQFCAQHYSYHISLSLLLLHGSMKQSLL